MPAVPNPNRDVVVNEVFGPAFQGEGPSTGRRAHFVRFFGCHLSCSWCDSAQTHDPTRVDLDAEHHVLDLNDIADQITRPPTDLIVITGGEPLLQPRPLGRLMQAVRHRQPTTDIEIETSGTIAPPPEITTAVTRFNVSPKLAHSGLHHHQRIRPAALRHLVDTGTAVWKFVVQRPSDLDEIQHLATTYHLAPIWVMPEGTDAHTILTTMQTLADPVLDRGWNLSTRLHTPSLEQHPRPVGHRGAALFARIRIDGGPTGTVP